MFTERSEPIMLFTCWYLCFQFHGLCGCHTLPLFGKSPLGIISFDFLYDSFTRTLTLLYFPVLAAFTPIPSTISHLWNQPCCVCWCSQQYADVILTLLRSFIKRDSDVHTHTYIYTYIQTLAQNWTAIIKISCLAMLGLNN